jgi:mannose-6-phosphate isomerase
VASTLEFFVRHYRRPDNLFSTLVHHDGLLADERAELYDQAFVLLALACCQEVLGPRAAIVDMGVGLRGTLLSMLRRPGGGFDSGPGEPPPLRSNPHMHLFEAALAWCAVNDDAGWRALADELGELALARMISPVNGAMYELFDGQWRPLPAGEGQAIEPGHQLEWAWLLLNFDSSPGSRAWQAALRLYEIGVNHGVNADGIVVNALKHDLTVQDGAARLWPHTEWLKAASKLARLTGEARYWQDAQRAAGALLRFLENRRPGLWWDRISADGKWVEEPAPASSFYHIVCAIDELGAQLG